MIYVAGRSASFHRNATADDESVHEDGLGAGFACQIVLPAHYERPLYSRRSDFAVEKSLRNGRYEDLPPIS